MEIRFENYVKQIQIESRVLGDMILTQVLPAAIKYQKQIGKNLTQLISIGIKKDKFLVQNEIIEKIGDHVNKLYILTNEMIEKRKKANKIEDLNKRASAYHSIKEKFDDIKYNSDKLEQIISDEYWPIPKYRELLFIK